MSKSSSAPGTGARPRIAQKDLAGTFAYRFEGYALRNLVSHRIVGIGHFTLDEDGRLGGHHTSSRIPMKGDVDSVSVKRYRLEGRLKLDQADGADGEAIIRFTGLDGGLDLDGKFRCVVAGSPDRLWFISTGSTIPAEGDQEIPELVSLEAIRMTDTAKAERR